MKKLIAILLVLVMLFAVGCGKIQDADTPDTEKEETVPPMLVRVGDKKVEPYINKISTETWYDGAWQSAEMASFTEKLDECKDKIPKIIFNSSFSVISNYGTSVKNMFIYDSESPDERTLTNMSGLNDLPAGNYYLVITISQKGQFVEAADGYESVMSECVYYLTKN